MTLRRNLIQLMKERKVKIKELARLTKISEPTIKRLRVIENSNPTLDVLIKLSMALRVNINELIQKPIISTSCYQNPEKQLINFGKNNETKLHPLKLNKNGLSTIDIEIFTLVLKEMLIAINNWHFQINYKEIIDFCYDIYNNIITTSADTVGKIAMIKLAIASLKRGNLLKKDLEDKIHKAL